MPSRNPVPVAASLTDIAIIAMAVRLPRARTLSEFWQLLISATECITIASDDDLRRAGTRPELLADPRYVRARSRVDDVELFDAEFFGMSPRQAEITDPQQRLFLECAWEALEQSGYAGDTHRNRVGVYAGASLSTYLLYHLWSNPSLLSSVGEIEALTANDKDYLATRVWYKLDLRGPSMTVQTACSTSLVAVHLACQSLIGGECDLALAGGVTIVVPQERGYLHRPGGIMAPDGHCRAFDAAAAGTVFGNGLGIVVLRRLDEALADGDSILAVIKGSAVNNDGGGKIGYTAPSVDGQAAVISEALAVADVHPATIGYIEAHGTGTPLGDPIEVAALSKVFAGSEVAPGSCALGSVKTNIGHLDAAAGIAGLAKAVLAVSRGAIPASLHFERANPEIDFSRSPFYVCSTLRSWPSTGGPRRAGVSSFGIGGTNAHVVLEEAPPRPPAVPPRAWQLLLISARSASALEASTRNLLDALTCLADEDLPDVAFTLQVGRKRFSHRRMLVVRDRTDAVRALGSSGREEAASLVEERDCRPVVFMFPGTGAQHVCMAKGLYEDEPVFHEHVDRCADLLSPMLRWDMRSLFTDSISEAWLERTDLAQPSLFAIEYSLARCWMAWGVRPAAMIGYSLGEYVAACLSGVFSLEDALALVVRRASLVQSVPAGSMLAVRLPEHEVLARIREPLAIAALNGPDLCVVSGPPELVGALERGLVTDGISTHRLRTSHAFHSSMMDGLVEPLTSAATRTKRQPPSVPFVSNVTGTWFSEADAENPGYWGRHLRQPVRFAEGWTRLRAMEHALFLEVGPGRSLAGIVHGLDGAEHVYPSLSHEFGDEPDRVTMLNSLGRLWLAGATVAWASAPAGKGRRRLPLPTYPFERRRFWVELMAHGGAPADALPEHEVIVEGSADDPLPRTSTHPRPILRTALVDPTTDVERIVARIWEELLGLSPIGVNDNFFELGGNSLMATQVVSRLQEAFPVEVPLREMFEAKTVGDLSRIVESLLAERIGSLTDDEAQQLLTESESLDEPLAH